MKKLFCILLIVLLLMTVACAENTESTVTVSFDDRFSLDIPSDWLSLPVCEEDAQQGISWSVCSADGTCRMLIEVFKTDCINVDQLLSWAEESYPDGEKVKYNYGDGSFVIFDLADDDASCACTLQGGEAVCFVFTPRSNPEFMQAAIAVLSSYSLG